MEIIPGNVLNGFVFQSCEDLPEIDGKAFTAIHQDSGSRLLVLQNDDNNKAFSISFRTPPQDDTGVFHILEHSVLCGSDRFPVKEPFVDLLKGSMQTFLNAMTFSDKTMYPVASTNEQDLYNLMDVYLDAVFHPQIYRKRAIFEQEGWHYELTGAPGVESTDCDIAALPVDQTQLVYNGVVYNEMKGALSDAGTVLYSELQKALFPNTPYAFESGGTPEAIPTLSYENYLDEHRRHYRTDNSYIVLYGNLDIERALVFLDERYLTPVAAEQRAADHARADANLEPLAPRTLNMQPPIVSPLVTRTMDTAPENACAGCGYAIGTAKDRLRVMAVDILLDALMGSNEAPLKRALLDSGIADDIIAFVADSLLQPFVVVQANMPHDGEGANLEQHLRTQVSALLESGIDHELIEASLAHTEFVAREHATSTADGVGYAMAAMASWLYDDDQALSYLRYIEEFATLRENLNTTYFEDLCRELFIDNNHRASVQVVPTPGVSDDDTDIQLAALNEELDTEDRVRIIDEEALLRTLQETPDPPEATATLPRLSISDIGSAPDEPPYDIDDNAPITCLRHHMPTRGIVYTYRYFDANCITFDELPYLRILALVLGKLDTTQHTAVQIDTLAQSKLGNLSFFTDLYDESGGDTEEPTLDLRFVVSASALADNVEWLVKLPVEVMTQTDFSNVSKIRDLLLQCKIGMEQQFINAGHVCAALRVRSYYSRAGIIAEQLNNVDFYQFLCALVNDFDKRAEELSTHLNDLANRLFVDNGCTMSFAGTDEDYHRFWNAQPGCGRKGDVTRQLVIPEPIKRNEGFVISSDVCFAGLGWDRRLLSIPFEGAWLVASRALSFDYLWNEVRVKGGAYGVGFQATRNGNLRFYSYRDPHLDETLARFAQASAWLAAFNPTQEDLEGFVVATTASIDAPIKPRMLVRRQASRYFNHHARDERIKWRQQVINTDVDDVRKLAAAIEQAVAQQAVCVFGNRDILESSTTPLEIIELFG